MTYCTDSNSLSLHILAICASQLFRPLALTLSGHILLLLLFKKKSIYLCLFIYLAALGLSCSMWFPDQGLNPGPLHWECGV